MRDIYSISRRGNALAKKNGHAAQLGLPDKGSTIKLGWLSVKWLGYWAFGQLLNSRALGCYQLSPEVSFSLVCTVGYIY